MNRRINPVIVDDIYSGYIYPMSLPSVKQGGKPRKHKPPIIVGRKGLFKWSENPRRNWLGIVIERHIEKINWCLENCVSFTGIRVNWYSYKNLDPIFKNAAEQTFYGLRWPNIDENRNT